MTDDDIARLRALAQAATPGTITTFSLSAVLVLLDEIERLGELLDAAGRCELIERVFVDTDDGTAVVVWLVISECVRYQGATLREALTNMVLGKEVKPGD